MTNNVKLIVGLVLLALLLVFIIQNAAIVELRFLFWKLSMSRSLVILFVLLIGLIIGWFASSHFQHKQHKIQKQEKQQP